jgi:hypothetical protein
MVVQPWVKRNKSQDIGDADFEFDMQLLGL